MSSHENLIRSFMHVRPPSRPKHIQDVSPEIANNTTPDLH